VPCIKSKITLHLLLVIKSCYHCKNYWSKKIICIVKSSNVEILLPIHAKQEAQGHGRPYGSNPGFKGEYEQDPSEKQAFIGLFTWEYDGDKLCEIGGVYPICWVSRLWSILGRKSLQIMFSTEFQS